DTTAIIEHSSTKPADNDTLNKRLDTYFIKVGFGRGLNFIIYRRIFFNLQGMIYGNIAYMNTFGNVHDRNMVSPNIFGEVAAGLGYNSERFFLGIRFSADRNTIRRNQFRYINTNGYAQVNVGYRFNSPKWLSKGYDLITHKLLKLS
ncbi:MAG TPA: DUF4421 family protein, partial [Cytophagales bacterium]|nr:DUF4421 family protein [Cytophagales bacterium]